MKKSVTLDRRKTDTAVIQHAVVLQKYGVAPMTQEAMVAKWDRPADATASRGRLKQTDVPMTHETMVAKSRTHERTDAEASSNQSLTARMRRRKSKQWLPKWDRRTEGKASDGR